MPERWGGGAPPATLDFQERYDVDRLAPRLGQLFFMGHGRDGDGRPQHFRIHTGAARLYLGIADAAGFRGPPGSYDDNDGRLRVPDPIRVIGAPAPRPRLRIDWSSTERGLPR